jgi:hypothetical protein
MYTNKDANGQFQSFGFLAPDGISTEKNEVLFPYYDKQTPAYGATLAVTVKQRDTFLQPGVLTGNVTINLTIDPQVTPGAKLYLKVKETADSANRTVTLGTGFDDDATDVTVVKATTVCRTFVYDGTSFVPENQ